MKIIVMGTGGFAVPSFRELVTTGHDIPGLITMPLRSGNRNPKKAGIPPIRAVAQELNISMYEPENINSEEGLSLLNQWQPDLIFVCDYGKILSREVINTARFGGINLHGSLLPRYRGAAPIQRAVLAGDEEIGVSVLHITPQMDAGPILARWSYCPTLQDTAVEIEERLAWEGANLVVQVVRELESGQITALPQDESLSSKAPKIRKEEGMIDWTRSAREIIHQYRALQPWPKTYSHWVRDNDSTVPPVRLILGPMKEETAFSDREPSIQPGTVIRSDKTGFCVQTGQGILRIMNVQPAGKKQMTAEAFVRGYAIADGDLLR